jgi:hypothetical protein
MKCSTEHHSRRLMYQAVKGDARAAMGRAIIKFVSGIRGPRTNPVTRKQIDDWFVATDKDFLGSVLLDLIADGKVKMGPRSLGSSRKFNGSYVYWLPEADNE